MACDVVSDVKSTFLVFFDDPRLEECIIIIIMTNIEAGRRRRRDGEMAIALIDSWRPMGHAEFRPYVGLLILAGMYRSLSEAFEILWHPEMGCTVFRTTMPLKTFRAYSTTLSFDGAPLRRLREQEHYCWRQNSSCRRGWCAWTKRLPLIYELGNEVTMDERMVPFKGKHARAAAGGGCGGSVQ